MSITGQRIRELRLQLNMTQEDLGAKVGLKTAAINKYETGLVVNLKRETIQELAKALRTSPSYLMGWDETKPPTTIAAHFDGDEYTEEELEKIKEFAKFVKNQRK
jgi:transcriptional regulator with XRE-family HTH domain